MEFKERGIENWHFLHETTGCLESYFLDISKAATVMSVALEGVGGNNSNGNSLADLKEEFPLFSHANVLLSLTASINPC